MKQFIHDVTTHLSEGKPLVIATVVDSSGSTPRSSGAKMAVLENGRIFGTVGGGVVEADAVKLAGELLAQDDRTALISKVDLTNELAAGTDMICGGRLTLCLERITPDSEAAAAYVYLSEAMRTGRQAALFTALDQQGQRAMRHALAEEPSALPDDFPSADIATDLFDKASTSGIALGEAEGTAILAERFMPPPALFLFGAGHVSLATARVAATIGFRVVVVDDRNDFANTDRFPFADEVRVIDSFENALHDLDVNEQAFVVILTRGHLHDKTVLGKVLQTPARYIGMIGSKKKRDAIYTALRKEGTTDEAISRCFCPIGLSIGAQTPEEIAISITSELIAVRAGIKE